MAYVYGTRYRIRKDAVLFCQEHEITIDKKDYSMVIYQLLAFANFGELRLE